MSITAERLLDRPFVQFPLDPTLATTHATFEAERPSEAEEDVHMVAALVDHVLERCSASGDLVFDPFSGFGTTVERAVALGRRALGIELLPERVEQLQRRVPSATVIEGDARELLRLVRAASPAIPDASVDLVLTSPPYMTAEDHEADPLTAYEHNNGDYGRYLAELGLVAAQCARLVVPGGFVVWNVADIHHMGQTTPLIADCAQMLERHFSPVGRTEVVWDRLPHDLVADALLVFRRDE
ncbi:DNA methyltransferase [Leucobacter komagatae]|uniref:DNA methyltransferase n=1 Tax=Leucobacter komagatae TaxID=55969 RepID=UPI0005AD1EA5|nr:DNA methyltransferase [Leucobacter komagatae]